MEYAGTLEIPAVIIFRNVIALQRLAGTIKKLKHPGTLQIAAVTIVRNARALQRLIGTIKKSLNHPGTLKNLP